jgi:hypothetical protein
MRIMLKTRPNEPYANFRSSVLGRVLANPASTAVLRAMLAVFAVLAGLARIGSDAGSIRRAGNDAANQGESEEH